MKENGALSIWIALDDVDESNGCMAFIPKSRNFGRVADIDLTRPKDIFKALKAGQKVEALKIMRMPAGSVTFHDGLTFHYAHPNTSNHTRHALAIIYMPDGMIYTGKKHMVTDGLGLNIGDELAGEQFPVLAKAEKKVRDEELVGIS